jgi:hypothetical protein
MKQRLKMHAKLRGWGKLEETTMSRELTRRRALAPLAGLALAAVALAPAAAQPAQPGTTARALTDAQKNRLNAALRYLRTAKAQITAANLSTGSANRLTTAVDAAIRDVELVLSGRLREPRG